jgi:hypothetical protein
VDINHISFRNKMVGWHLHQSMMPQPQTKEDEATKEVAETMGADAVLDVEAVEDLEAQDEEMQPLIQ